MLLLSVSSLEAGFDLGGYVKSLNFVSHQSGGYRELSGNRVRLDGRWQDSKQIFDLRVINDNELLYGSLLASQRTVLDSNLARNELLDPLWTLNEKDRLIWRHLLYRAYAKAGRDGWSLTAGRQRIAWGQGRLWNPTDTINPYNPLSVEREERPGSDSLDAQWSWGGLSFLEAVYVPKKDWKWDDSLLLGRARANIWQMDWGAMGGKRGEENFAGFDHAAQVFEGSLRSEGTYHFNSGLRRDFARAVLSYDYNFSFDRPLYVLGEFYYNGIGERRKEDYPKVALKPGEQAFLAKEYSGLGLSWDLTPLLKAECYTILNMDDGSVFAGPRLRWQPIQDLEFGGGYQAFLGGDGTEFGEARDAGFLQVQWFF